MSINLGHLKNRDQERLISNKTDFQNAEIVFLTHPNDLGVQLNGGRRGAEYAPKAILSILEKFTFIKPKKWHETQVCFEEYEFSTLQKNTQKNIEKIISSSKDKKYIAIGGGHDHVFPFLCALNSNLKDKKWHIINIDAHLDTRVDQVSHSGTPFRQWDEFIQKEYYITQLGIHDFANSLSTKKNLKFGSQKIFNSKELNSYSSSEMNQFFLKNFPKDENIFYFLSLDADALTAEGLEGVSAPNGLGLNSIFVENLFHYFYSELNGQALGIYEYNPLYDNLSCKGARKLAAFLYPLLENK